MRNGFKAATFYQHTRAEDLSMFTPGVLESKLEEFKHKSPSEQTVSTTGFVQVIGDNLVHQVGDFIFIKVNTETRQLPKEAIKKLTKEKAEAFEQANGVPPSTKVRNVLEEEALQEILPRTFTKTSSQYIVINTKTGVVMVDSANHKKCDDALALLRKAIDTLPVTPFTLERSRFDEVLTGWLKENVPAPFNWLGDIKAVSHGSSITVRQCELSEPSILAALEGYLVEVAAFEYFGPQDAQAEPEPSESEPQNKAPTPKATFTAVSEDSLKSIKLHDVFSDYEGDDVLAQREANYLLYASETFELFHAFFAALEPSKSDQ